MSLIEKIEELKNSTAEQTLASQALAQEVAGKIGQINQKLSDAERQFLDFISGDFKRNVNAAKSVAVFVDPLSGDDNNSGLNSASSIKTSSRLKSLLDYEYDIVRIVIRKGTVFDLEHPLRAKDSIFIDSWDAKDAATSRAELRQSVPSQVHLSAPDVRITNAKVSTYRAKINEVLPEVYKRA